MSEMAALTARDYAIQLDRLIERSRRQQATALLAEALALYPDDSGLQYEAARLAYLDGNNEQARRALHTLLGRDPEHYAGRSLLASVHQEAGELEQAEAVLIGLLKDYPEAAFQYARYAMLMYRTLNIGKAQALAREALRLDPEDELALSACLIGDIIAGRPGARQASLATLMQRHPESEITARMLISHLVSRGRYRAAKHIAIELLKLHPHSREILELVVQLESLSHWSMLPLWPLNRWGWAASGVLYVGSLVLMNALRKLAPGVSGYATAFLLSYCAYSWIYPSLLTRWLKRRAGL